MGISLNVDLVLGADGHIDQAASSAAFQSALVRAVAERETEEVQIAAAVAEVFDQYRGQSIQMPALGSMVAQKLNAQPENFKVLQDRALDYVRTNSQGETPKGGTAERPDSLFVIGKGKGGGCYRRADRPAKETK